MEAERKAELKNYIDRLHAIAEEFHTAKIRPEDQCALRWTANMIAEKIIESEDSNG